VNVRIGFCVIQRATILTCFLSCFTNTAFAVDGVVLIDQTRALAGNVTPGDAPGFPVTLSLPGSYRLSGNLTAPAGTDGILIRGNNSSFNQFWGIRAPCPSTVIENVARNNGQDDINLGPSPDCTRANNSPTP
jgi:hypothetical protein